MSHIISSVDGTSHQPLRYVLLGAVALALLARLLLVGMRGRKAPPGPRTLPIIGNLHQMPERDLHLQYQKWAKQYGPMFHLKLGSQDVVVLASGQMVKRLVDKRSGNYADRPALYMQDIWEQSRIIMRGYDDLWKVERKLYHQFLNVTKAGRYVPYQDLETKQLCFDLLEQPERFENLITRTTLSAATSMAYGFRVTDTENEMMKELLRNTHGFFKMVYNSKLLDWYPQLRSLFARLPSIIYPLTRQAKEIFHKESAQFHDLFNGVLNLAKSANPPASFSADIINAQRSWKGSKDGNLLTDHAGSYIAGIAMEGGADTSSNTLAGFVKAMILFPETQKRAQEELDRVVGSDRLPTIDDLDSLPYIRGVMKETLRWMPTAIGGAIPHAARAQDEIDGHVIPAGATVILAVWAINNDPELFPEPRKFDPLRHNPNRSLGEAASSVDVQDRDQWTFGAGRRICPGIHVAERMLFMGMSRILWAFELSKARDPQGNEIDIDPDEVTQSIAARPVPFRCNIAPRSPKHAEIVREQWGLAQEILDDRGNYKTTVL